MNYNYKEIKTQMSFTISTQFVEENDLFSPGFITQKSQPKDETLHELQERLVFLNSKIKQASFKIRKDKEHLS